MKNSPKDEVQISRLLRHLGTHMAKIELGIETAAEATVCVGKITADFQKLGYAQAKAEIVVTEKRICGNKHHEQTAMLTALVYCTRPEFHRGLHLARYKRTDGLEFEIHWNSVGSLTEQKA